MTKGKSAGTWAKALFLALIWVATPASAERLTFDHRLYPPLKAVLDSGDTGMIDYNARNPAFVVDLIAIRGKSAADWSEAIEIVSRLPSKDVNSAQSWLEDMRRKSDLRCPNAITIIEDAGPSVTFERNAANCRQERIATKFTRIIAGRRSLFEISFLFKSVPEKAVRDQALAMLASAHLD